MRAWTMFGMLMLVALAGCGGDDEGASADAATSDGATTSNGATSAGATSSGTTSAGTTSNGATTSNSGGELFTLSSPLLDNGGALPDDLRCERDGGDGASPPLEWSNAPEGTQSFAVTMHHWPTGADPTTGTPNHYWLLWNVDGDVAGLSRGNSEGLGNVGSDKDGASVGYTPPCSPPGAEHLYTITVHALSEAPASLGSEDDISVDWAAMTSALEGITLGTAALDFVN